MKLFTENRAHAEAIVRSRDYCCEYFVWRSSEGWHVSRTDPRSYGVLDVEAVYFDGELA